MNNFYSKFFLLSSLFLLSVANVNADEQKIAVVNQQTAIENSLCGKNYQEGMQKELDSRQAKLNGKKDLVKKKYESLQRDKDILSKKELENKEKELETLQQDLQKMHEKFEMELGNKDQEEHQKINKWFTKAVENIGAKDKYDLVLPANVVFYFGDNVGDITSNVTAELDKVYKEQAKKK